MKADKYTGLYLYYLPGWMLGSLWSYLGYVGKAWSALPVLALAVLGVRLARAWRGGGLADEQRWQLVWLTFAVTSLLVLVPWGGSTLRIARYLLPLTMFTAIFIGQEVAWLFDGARRLLVGYAQSPGKYELQRMTLRGVLVFVVVLVGLVVAINVPLAYKAGLDAWRLEAVNGKLVRGLAAQAPRDTPLYAKLTVDHEEEIRYAIGLHLRMIYGRKDFGRDESLKYFGLEDDPAVPDMYRRYMGLPQVGEWVLVPWSVSRYRYQPRIDALSELLRPTQVFLVTAKGWESVVNSRVLMDKLDELKEAWVVMVTGQALDVSGEAGGGG